MIRRNIIKIVATRCQILWLKCAKFDFGCGSVPDHAGELTALPTHLAGSKGLHLRGEGREEEREGKKIRKKGKGSEGKGELRGKRSPCSDFTI